MNGGTREYHPPFAYPRGITKWLMKMPILLYRLGLGFLIGDYILILTTKGRRSGQPRLTAIEHRRLGGDHYVFSAWGSRPDWYRNILKDPHIHVWAGKRKFKGVAEVLTETEKAKAMCALLERYNLRLIHRLLGIEVEPTEEQMTQLSAKVTIVRLRPS